MKPPRIIVDTNVLASGLRSRHGASYRLLSLLGTTRLVTVVTVPLVIEYEKALCDPDLGIPFSADEVRRYLDYVCSVSDCQRVHFLWRPFLRDQKDDMVLEAAFNGQCRYIVTFNLSDFDGIKRLGIVPIKPRDLLESMGELP